MDPISDMFTQIRNALAVKKPLVSVPLSNFKQEIVQLLIDQGYLKGMSRAGHGVKKFLKIDLKYEADGEPAIREIKKISKQGQRIYLPKDKIKPVKSGLGHLIVSTSQGLMIDVEAKKKGLGGEIIGEIF